MRRSGLAGVLCSSSGVIAVQIRSRIKGAFSGWHSDALFPLENGQFWIQSEYKYEYFYSYRPTVMITEVGGEFLLETEGMADRVRVRSQRPREPN